MNYIFYSAQKSLRLTGDLKDLFELFFENYLEKTGDDELLEVIAPFFAFRAVVVASPPGIPFSPMMCAGPSSTSWRMYWPTKIQLQGCEQLPGLMAPAYMKTYAFELSGEHESLPRCEALALVEAFSTSFCELNFWSSA